MTKRVRVGLGLFLVVVGASGRVAVAAECGGTVA